MSTEVKPHEYDKAEWHQKPEPLTKTLWVNPNWCELCGAMIDEQVGMERHEKRVHPQGKLDGTPVTEEDKRAVIISSLPHEPFQCPFCFLKMDSVATRFFLDSGQLAKMVLCKKEIGGCGRRMQLETMRWTKGPPRDFGRQIGYYSKFWFGLPIERDEWMKRLKLMLPKNASLKWDDPLQPINQFWLGYGEARPEFAEKQRQKKAERDYEEATRGASRDDEGGL